MRRWLGRIAALLGALIFIIIAGEILIRATNAFGISHFRDAMRYNTELCDLVGPPRILKHKPSRQFDAYDFSIRINALGLRGEEVPSPKPADETRILFIGDSVTLGWGAEEKDLFVTRAEKELQQSAPPGRRIRCINAGENMYDTAQELATLQEIGDKVQPDAVLLTYVVNDVVLTRDLYDQYIAAPPPTQWQLWKGWILGVPLRGWGGIMMYYSQMATNGDEQELKEKAQAALDSKGWKVSSESLIAMRDWCRERKVPFIVLDHTPPGDAATPPAIPPLRPLLEREGIPRFPFHFTPEENRLPIRHSASDPHANAAGHALLFEKLKPALRSLGYALR